MAVSRNGGRSDNDLRARGLETSRLGFLAHLYFNRLAGPDMATIKHRFELDYWGLSYRQALEHIVRSDSSRKIRIKAANYPGVVNSVMLEPVNRARLEYVNELADADYFVTNYRFHPDDYPLANEVFSVRVGNGTVASVFRLRNAGR